MAAPGPADMTRTQGRSSLRRVCRTWRLGLGLILVVTSTNLAPSAPATEYPKFATIALSPVGPWHSPPQLYHFGSLAPTRCGSFGPHLEVRSVGSRTFFRLALMVLNFGRGMNLTWPDRDQPAQAHTAHTSEDSWPAPTRRLSPSRWQPRARGGSDCNSSSPAGPPATVRWPIARPSLVSHWQVAHLGDLDWNRTIPQWSLSTLTIYTG